MLSMFFSCFENPTKPDFEIYLSSEQVVCTWASFIVTLPDSGDINTFALERNDSTVGVFTCKDNDTLVIDEGLKPDSDYSYSVRFIKDGENRGESDVILVHSLPTTTCEFSWEVDTLGVYYSSINDAWIVNENDIWVVGSIQTDSVEYNVARWDGEKWNLSFIYSNTLDLDNIFYFSEDDIWLTAGWPIHWNGTDCEVFHLDQMGVSSSVGNDIWATSPSNIYFVGDKGRIVHYDGTNFEKINSGTDANLTCIDGTDDGKHIFIGGYK